MEATAPQRDCSRDFDFLFGIWRVRHRRLRRPLSDSDEWYEFDSEYKAVPIWGGKANLDEFAGESPLGRFEGLTLRLYDTASQTWSLYWATAKNGLTVTPNVGTFTDEGVGEFFSDELFDGKPIRCRYRWIQQYESGCRWEQAFSADGGRRWETNWTMDFTRA